MIALHSVVASREDQVCCELGDEVVILSLTSGEYFGLNPIGARIWNCLRTPVTVREILETLHDYDVDPGLCERDVMALLEQLEADGLIDVRAEKGPAA